MVTGCFFLGNIAGAPELHLEQREAEEIAEALKELSKHYPIGMSEKAIAWVNFSFAVGGVFGPKIVAIYNRPKPKRIEPTPIRGTAAVDDVAGPRVPDAAIDAAGPTYSVVEPPAEQDWE